MKNPWKERVDHIGDADELPSIELRFLCNELHATSLDLGAGIGTIKITPLQT